jgi:hypothetical protein
VNQSAGFDVLLVNVDGGATLTSIPGTGSGALTYTKTTVSTGSSAADNHRGVVHQYGHGQFYVEAGISAARSPFSSHARRPVML